MSHYIYYRFDGIVKDEYRKRFAEALRRRCWSYLDPMLDGYDDEYDYEICYNSCFGQYDEESGRYRMDTGINISHHPIDIIVDLIRLLHFYFDSLYIMSFDEEDEEGYVLYDAKNTMDFSSVLLPYSDEKDGGYCCEMPFRNDISEYAKLIADGQQHPQEI